MTCNKNMGVRARSLGSAIVIVFLSAGAALAQETNAARPLNDIMQDLVSQVVQETGIDIAGVGSWISKNKKYIPGKSDHDLRMVLSKEKFKELGPEGAAKAWRQAQSRLQELVKMTLSNTEHDPNTILKNTNFYPPNQLMDGVENSADALEAVRKSGAVPNLGYVGTMDDLAKKAAAGDEAALELVEGLYGKGAQAFRQRYEASAGKLYYLDKKTGKVFSGGVDLTHFAEELGLYSTVGSGNTARQWSEKLLHELGSSNPNPKTIAKYLERMNNDILKGTDLAGAGLDPNWTAKVKNLEGKLSKLFEAVSDPTTNEVIPELLAKREAEFTKFMEQAGKVQKQGFHKASILSKWDDMMPMERDLMDNIMRDLGKEATELDGLIHNVPWKTVAAKAALFGLSIYLSKEALEGDDVEQAFLDEMAGVLPGVSPVILGLITAQIMKSSKDLGHGLAVMHVDLNAFLGGVSGDKSEGFCAHYDLPIWKIVKFAKDERSLKNTVEGRAIECTRNPEEAKVLIGKVYPKIKRIWTYHRQLARKRLEIAVGKAFKTPLLLTYSPVPAKLPKGDNPKLTVTLTANTGGDQRNKLKPLIEKALAPVSPDGVIVTTYHLWSVDKSDETVAYLEADKPGTYPVELTFKVSARLESATWDSGSPFRFEKDAKATIDVIVLPADAKDDEEKEKKDDKQKKPQKPKVTKKPEPKTKKPTKTQTSGGTRQDEDHDSDPPEWVVSNNPEPTFEPSPGPAGNSEPCAIGEDVANALLARISSELDNPSRMASLANRLLKKDAKAKLLNCICRVHSGKTSSVSVWFQTTPHDGSDSCMDVSNGPCVGQGWGCSRSRFIPDRKALEHCGAAKTVAEALCRPMKGG
ncbi:hypothetical protein [Roseibium sp.]|uniref:hypothetical protein n=1 Tax=Roseibium sp. TaxID=1936156 RepID=UPI0039F09C8E